MANLKFWFSFLFSLVTKHMGGGHRRQPGRERPPIRSYKKYEVTEGTGVAG